MNSKSGKRPSASVRRSKRLKLLADQSESGDSGNVVLENQCSINDLPVECVQMIISYFPGRHWPRLELVNRQFRSGVLACWQRLNEVHLKKYSEKSLVEQDEEAAKRSLLSILRLAQIRSPNVQMIDGFEAFIRRLDTEIVEEISKFETLKSVAFSDCWFSYKDLVTFLANSQRRGILEDLRVTNTHFPSLTTGSDGVAIRRALINMEGYPGLRLKTFHYEPTICRAPSRLLPALDVSGLETLSITGSHLELPAMVKLLGRCTQLKDLNIVGCTWMEAILNALKSLSSPNLRKLGLYYEWCYFRDESVVEALRALAQRCPKVEVLVILCNNSDAMLKVIGECFGNLKKLHVGISDFREQPFAGLTTRMGQLKKLGLHFLSCTYDSCRVDGMMTAIATNMNSLISLHLDCPPALTNDAMSKLERMKLKELSVKFSFVDQGAIAMCERLGPKMVSVHFDRMGINDQQLVAAIGKNMMSQLRRLSLKYASITDRGLQAIADSCPLLEELDIGYYSNVTAHAIRGIIEKCKKLISLKVHWKIAGLRDVIRDTTVIIETQWY